jgi:glycopeptide antibiotics resistance protein
MLYIEFFPYLLLLGLLALTLACFSLRKRGWVYLAGLTVFGFYLLFVIDMMFFPIPIPEGWPYNLKWDAVANSLAHNVNLIPGNYGSMFSYAALGRISSQVVFEQIAGNVLLTLPFGLGIGFLTRLRGWRLVWLGMGTGLALEGAQLLFMLIGVGYPHSVDINDVLLNALGVWVGYGLCQAAKRGIQRIKSILFSPINH